MKTQDGYVQGYNAQAVVTEAQIIVVAAVTQEEHDIHQLHPMLTQAQENLHTIEHPQAITTALADAGYCSEANLREADAAGPALLIAPNKDWKQRKALWEQPPPRGRCPKRLTAPRPHGANVADEARTASVQATRPDGRAGVRTEQEYPWL